MVFENDSDRLVYFDLLCRYSRLHDVTLIGYCMMSNHVHLIAVPHRPEALAVALRSAHGRFATFWNARRSTSGHVWQGRYYSCVLEGAHLWTALRYAELNPVRAGVVTEPESYYWSSATAHIRGNDDSGLLDMETWARCWTAGDWRDYLNAACTPDELQKIRRSTHTGRPLGSVEFVRRLEGELNRSLEPNKGGRPRKARPSAGQLPITLAAAQ